MGLTSSNWYSGATSGPSTKVSNMNPSNAGTMSLNNAGTNDPYANPYGGLYTNDNVGTDPYLPPIDPDGQPPDPDPGSDPGDPPPPDPGDPGGGTPGDVLGDPNDTGGGGGVGTIPPAIQALIDQYGSFQNALYALMSSGFTTTANPIPLVPGMEGGGYTQSENAFNPINPDTWSLLAPYAAQVAGDLDAQKAQMRQGMQAGGVRDLALGRAMNSAYSNIAQGRQNLMSQSLSQIANMQQQQMFGTSAGGYSGAAGDLLGSYDTRYTSDQNYDLGLQQLAQALEVAQGNQSSANMSAIFGSLGSMLPMLISLL